MRYHDIPPGETIKTTTSALKKPGFKVIKKLEDKDDAFYGTHQVVFLLGDQDG